MTEKKDKLLFSEFPPVSSAAWEEKINKDLKGEDYEKKLIWKPVEGLTIKPYYRSEDLAGLEYLDVSPGEFPFTRGTKTENNDWLIRQDIWVEDSVKANQKALEIIGKGITSIGFNLTKKNKPTQRFLETLLKEIPLNSVELNFTGYKAEELAGMLTAFLRDNNYDNEDLRGSINFDPLGRLCKKGNFSYDSEELSIKKLLSLVMDIGHLSGFRTICINACYFGNSGSSVVQELAFGLAMGAEYLSILTDRGIQPAEAARKISFNFAVSSGYFMEIARYRAARLLWSTILEAFDPHCKESMHIHAETAKWNLSQYDPYINMLRTTTESMSAILAGVDSLTVLPYDITFEEPSEFAERIARNQQIILKEESYFDKVIDPAAGSYFIENLTDSIAAEAWKLFLEVLEKGGFIAAFKQGFIQMQVNEMAQKRDMAIATRREIMLGTNQYPDFREVYTENPHDHATEYCCTCKEEKFACDEECCCNDKSCNCDCAEENCECSCCSESKRIAAPLKLYRATREFEKLRLRTDLGKTRPKVFMLTVGNLAMRLARSQFSCNFFACAGYEIIDNNGFISVDEGIKIALDTRADIVVLCSSDDEYAVFAPEAYEKLNGRAILVVAGAPSCMEDLKTRGIENFIHIRSNVLETLKQFNQKLSIKE
jgi:methylmalonyl-CoA mutase